MLSCPQISHQQGLDCGRKRQYARARERERALELVLFPKMMMNSYVKRAETRFLLVFISGSEWLPATITFSLRLLVCVLLGRFSSAQFFLLILLLFPRLTRDLFVRRRAKNTRPSPAAFRTHTLIRKKTEIRTNERQRNSTKRLVSRSSGKYQDDFRSPMEPTRSCPTCAYA